MRVGQLEFLKVNAEKQEWRDVYHWILSLSWPRFALLILGVYLAINLIFAALYAMGGPCIAGMAPGSFISAFFFSAETLATVDYGHMYPQTVYGHAVTTLDHRGDVLAGCHHGFDFCAFLASDGPHPL